MVRALLSSQWPGKPAPKLYALFRLLLTRLPSLEEPQACASIFLIKIFVHEGVLELSSTQSSSCRYGGELYSLKEAPGGSQNFSSDEEQLLTDIAQSRSLAHLTTLALPLTFQAKISLLFDQAFTH